MPSGNRFQSKRLVRTSLPCVAVIATFVEDGNPCVPTTPEISPVVGSMERPSGRSLTLNDRQTIYRRGRNGSAYAVAAAVSQHRRDTERDAGHRPGKRVGGGFDAIRRLDRNLIRAISAAPTSIVPPIIPVWGLDDSPAGRSVVDSVTGKL